MALATGTRFGDYEILAPIGAGGMGEVYRARDIKLKRDVALKVLPDAFARDPGRLARFQREAEVLASLNHTNIAHIYGVEEGALVMELVEGESPKGPLPFEDAWKIALQIADALEYAHERAVIHRDLKPANLKVTPDGVVKLLDFGLAKALSETPDAGSADPENSPTVTLGATVAGSVLGTAAYMSPEQARGKRVDRRVDIWSWGVVLYELITGKRLFEGEDVSHTLASVIMKEPTLEEVPVEVRRVLQSCLEKDPKKRLRDIGDVWRLMETGPQPAATVQATPLQSGFFYAGWMIAGAALAAAAVLSFVHFREKPPAAEPLRFEITAPEPNRIVAGPAISPDGRKIAFSTVSADGRAGSRRVWVRSLDSLTPRPLTGTEDVSSTPAWSPDSRFVLFTAQGYLKKMEAAGGPAQTLCNVDGSLLGASWGRDEKGTGTIVFGVQGKGLMRVPEVGGQATPVTAIDSSRQGVPPEYPSFLPDGRHFVYLRGFTSDPGIYLGSLDAKPDQQPLKRLIATESAAVYSPSPDPTLGYILFVREGALMAQSFDNRRLETIGDAIPVPGAENLSNTGIPPFSASTTGTLVHWTGNGGQHITTQLTWYDRSGKPLGTVGHPGDYNTVSLSPDGTRVAVSRRDLEAKGRGIGGNTDLWVHELAQPDSDPMRLTFDPGVNWMGVWSPDSNTIIFSSDREGFSDIYRKASNGTGKEVALLKSSERKFPYDWSLDGRFLLYNRVGELWTLPLAGDDRKPQQYLQAVPVGQARFSPDGHFVAYASNPSGKIQVFVQPFPNASEGQWQISSGGGNQPHWRRDGKELYYISADSKLMAVDMSQGPAKHGTPKALFAAPIWGGGTTGNVTRYDVTADGKKFLINSLLPEPASAASVPATVVLNWTTELKK